MPDRMNGGTRSRKRRRPEQTRPAPAPAEEQRAAVPDLAVLGRLGREQPHSGIQGSVVRGAMLLQSSQGNQRVSRLLHPEAGESSRDANSSRGPGPKGRDQSRQRATKAPGTTRPPKAPAISATPSGINRIGGLTAILGISSVAMDREKRRQVRAKIMQAGLHLAELKKPIEDLGEEAAAEDIHQMVSEIIEWVAVLDNLTEEVSAAQYENMNEMLDDSKKLQADNMALLRRRTTSSFGDFTDETAPDLSSVLPDLQEQAHFGFIEGSEDVLKPGIDAVAKVKEHQGNVAKVLDWAQKASKMAGDAETVADLEKAIGQVKGVGGALDKITKVAKTARAIATISGLDNDAVADYEKDIDSFETAIDAIDAVGIVDAVPLLGTLWSKYYVPVTKQCLGMLRKIGRERDFDRRELGFFTFQETGSLGDYRKFFPGGEPVLRFMLAIMRDEDPKPSAKVRKFFLEKRDIFNIPFEGGTNELESEGGIFSDEKLTNLLPWVKLNKHLVWAMLYGRFDAPGT